MIEKLNLWLFRLTQTPRIYEVGDGDEKDKARSSETVR